MTRTRADYLICSKAPRTPAGVIFWAGDYDILDADCDGLRERIAVPRTTLFRDDATGINDRPAAEAIAMLLTDFGPRTCRWYVTYAHITPPQPVAAPADVAAGMAAIRDSINALLEGDTRSPGNGAGDVTGGQDAALINPPLPARHNLNEGEA